MNDSFAGKRLRELNSWMLLTFCWPPNARDYRLPGERLVDWITSKKHENVLFEEQNKYANVGKNTKRYKDIVKVLIVVLKAESFNIRQY